MRGMGRGKIWSFSSDPASYYGFYDVSLTGIAEIYRLARRIYYSIKEKKRGTVSSPVISLTSHLCVAANWLVLKRLFYRNCTATSASYTQYSSQLVGSRGVTILHV